MSFLRNILNDPNRLRATVTVRTTGQRTNRVPSDRDRDDHFENQPEHANAHQFENPPNENIDPNLPKNPYPEFEKLFKKGEFKIIVASCIYASYLISYFVSLAYIITRCR